MNNWIIPIKKLCYTHSYHLILMDIAFCTIHTVHASIKCKCILSTTQFCLYKSNNLVCLRYFYNYNIAIHIQCQSYPTYLSGNNIFFSTVLCKLYISNYFLKPEMFHINLKYHIPILYLDIVY